jgi:alcohol dehydrogenase class IV
MSFIQLPSKVHFGEGSVSVLAGRIKSGQVDHILLFTDKNLRTLGVTAEIEKILKETGVSFAIADDVVPEPSVGDIEHTMVSVSSFEKPQMIIACGGGSVMDTAKLASVLLGAPYKIGDLLQNPQGAEKQCRTIMIPTTCGTGSEATCNAIVSIPQEESKKGIVNNSMIPDEVILDPLLIADLPKTIVAATGVDALAHCVECYTSRKATPLSDLYAAAGAKLIFHNIEKAYAGESGARANMLLGSFYGGAAITGSGTTAVHALAYPLGGKFHIAHGVSNAILFAKVMAFNKDACVSRLASLCDVVYPGEYTKSADQKADIIITRIEEIVANTKIPVSLKEFGITEKDLEFLVDAGSKQTRLLVNNMKELSIEDIRAIYRQVI